VGVRGPCPPPCSVLYTVTQKFNVRAGEAVLNATAAEPERVAHGFLQRVS
jgi:hypothetical protein